MNKPFHELRRQPFLTEAFANQQILRRERMAGEFATELAEPDTDLEGASLLTASAADDCYEHLSLRYTAGEPIEQLRNELDSVVRAYEQYQKALAEYEQIPRITVFSFKELAHYERCMQLIGLCYLLHRRDLLPRIAALQDPGYFDEDTLYEDLLCYELQGRSDVDALYWREPYEHLVHAMYRDTNDESMQDIQAYLKVWYPAFKYAPWHDGHLRINGTEGDYFGYWAFEAGAVAYLLDLDDSAITHMVYPKDLVAWARANKHLHEEWKSSERARGRCEAGQPCPREGWWFTPAKFGSRRHFQQGEVMPAFSTDYGSTIWQWDQRQGA